MSQIPDDNAPMSTLTQAVAYFLAGSFIVETLIIPFLNTSHFIDKLTLGGKFTLGIGIILIVYAFILSFAALRITRPTFLVRLIPKIHRLSIYLSPVFFTVAASEIVSRAVTFINIPELQWMLWITIAFGIIVIVAILYTSAWIFSRIYTLLLITLSFCAMAIISILRDSPRTTNLIIVGVILLVTFRTFYLYRLQRGFQLRLFKFRIFKRK